jgi:hypothetical protein
MNEQQMMAKMQYELIGKITFENAVLKGNIEQYEVLVKQIQGRVTELINKYEPPPAPPAPADVPAV